MFFAAGSLSSTAQVRTPTDFLGYTPGTRFTPHHRVVDYVEHVAGASPWVTLQTYGESYEGRPLLLATVTAPQNHARLEELRAKHLAQTGLTDAAPAEGEVAVVWLSYGIHGNESVSTESALVTLHHLVSRPEAQEWLENTVVLLDPCLNPDGRERYVHWYQQTVGYPNNPHPDAWEHHEPWPRGRGNHYLFDLNRDWAWQTQQESQARHTAYQRWLPHVHADFHEMGPDDSYFFAPSAEPIHAAVTDFQREFQGTIGRNHADYFDREGWRYFTREVYDLFYPSYGDTWPVLHGAIGMTYEQGGSGRAGLAYIVDNGDTLTLSERLIHHHTTGLSTVEAAATHADRLNQEFRAYFKRAVDAPDGTYKTYVLRGDTPARRDLLDYLTRQQVRWGYAERATNVRGAYDYQSGRTGDLRTGTADVIVPAAQPYAALVRTLFEPRTALPDSLTYDITAWALPYAWGVEAYATSATLPYRAAAAPNATTTATLTQGRPYAYVLP
ncbi:MAG: M14 metallopeptidase family protein, partial [Catalinimonas sp.]